MIPIQYALLGFGLSALVGAVLTIVFRPSYDRLAERIEHMTAEEAQSIADHFSALAKELKAPGK